MSTNTRAPTSALSVSSSLDVTTSTGGNAAATEAVGLHPADHVERATGTLHVASLQQPNTALGSKSGGIEEYLLLHRFPEIMEHLAFAIIQSKPEDHVAFTRRWLANLRERMSSSSQTTAHGINLFSIDGNKLQKCLPPQVLHLQQQIQHQQVERATKQYVPQLRVVTSDMPRVEAAPLEVTTSSSSLPSSPARMFAPNGMPLVQPDDTLGVLSMTSGSKKGYLMAALTPGQEALYALISPSHLSVATPSSKSAGGLTPANAFAPTAPPSEAAASTKQFSMTATDEGNSKCDSHTRTSTHKTKAADRLRHAAKALKRESSSSYTNALSAAKRPFLENLLRIGEKLHADDEALAVALLTKLHERRQAKMKQEQEEQHRLAKQRQHHQSHHPPQLKGAAVGPALLDASTRNDDVDPTRASSSLDAPARRRIAISATPLNVESAQAFQITEVEKTADERAKLMQCVEQCSLFTSLDDAQKELVVRAMVKEDFPGGCEILSQGQPGKETFFLVVSGIAEVIKDRRVVAPINPGQYFGELELMYNAADCAATIKTVTPVATYKLGKETYQHIVLNAALARRALFQRQIERVGIFSMLKDYDKMRVAEALTIQEYAEGESLIRCGEPVSYMYVVMEGLTRVIGRTPEGQPVNVIDLGTGHVIGELEFIFRHNAVADVVALSKTCRVAKLNRKHFEMIIGEDVTDEMKHYIATMDIYKHYMDHAQDAVKKDIEGAQKRKARRNRATNVVAPTPKHGTSKLLGDINNSSLAAILQHSGGSNATLSEVLLDNHARLISNLDPFGEVVFEHGSQLSRFPLKAVTSAASNKIVVIGLLEDGTVHIWNDIAYKVTQYKQDQALGQSIFTFLTSESEQTAFHTMLRIAREWLGSWEAFVDAGLHKPKVYQFTRSDGLVKVPLSLTVVPTIFSEASSGSQVLIAVGTEVQIKPPTASHVDLGKWLKDKMQPRLTQLTKIAQSLTITSNLSSCAGTTPPSQSHSPQTKDISTGGGTPRHTPSPLHTSFEIQSGPSISNPNPPPAVAVAARKLKQSIVSCEKTLEQFTRIASTNLEQMQWLPVSVHLLLQRLVSQVSADVRDRGNHITVEIDEDISPGHQVFLDVDGMMQVLTLLVDDVNCNLRGVDIVLRAEITTEEGGMSQPMTRSFSASANELTLLKQSTIAPSPASMLGESGALLRFVVADNGEWDCRPRPSTMINVPAEEVPRISFGDHDDNRDGTATGGGVGFTDSLRNSNNPLQGDPSHSDDDSQRRGETAANVALGSDDDLEEGLFSTSNGRGAHFGDVKIILSKMGGIFGTQRIRDPQLATHNYVEVPLVMIENNSNDGAANAGSSAAPVGGNSNAPPQGESFTTVLVERSAVQRNNVCQVLWSRRHAVLPVTCWIEVTKLVEAGTCDILVIDPELLKDDPTFHREDGSDPFDVFRTLRHRIAIIVTSEGIIADTPTSAAVSVGSLSGKPLDEPLPTMDLLSPDAQPHLQTDAAHTSSGESHPSTSSGATTSAGPVNNLIRLPKPWQMRTLVETFVAAEKIVLQFREEEKRIAALRSTFSETKRGAYETVRLLGRGAFGEVHEVVDELTGGRMAMKMMRLKQEADVDALVEEIRTMTQLQHENIIHYFYCEKSSDNELKIFMELASGGTLQDKIKRTPGGCGLAETEILRHLRDLLNGLQYIHAHRYLHCDIKTANALLDSKGRTKLGDFGEAKKLKEGEKIYVMSGTPAYMAPEVMSADAAENIGYDFKADIWSLGCVVLEMATGQPPFFHVDGTQGMGIFRYVSELTEPPDLSPLFHCGPLLFQFVRACLEPNPDKRPSAAELQKFTLLTDGVAGDATLQAEKIVKRAQLLHVLNSFVAFVDPDEDVSRKGRRGSRRGSRKSITSVLASTDTGDTTTEYASDGAEDDFFNSDDDEEDDEEDDGEDGGGDRQLLVQAKKGGFFSDSDDDE